MSFFYELFMDTNSIMTEKLHYNLMQIVVITSEFCTYNCHVVLENIMLIYNPRIIAPSKKNVMGRWQSEACSQYHQTLETQTAFFLFIETNPIGNTIVKNRREKEFNGPLETQTELPDINAT